MRTLILSDLHLGSVSRSDLLRRPEFRAPLMRAAEDVDRVVLLGDVLELRHGPPREALAVSRPFFEDLGRALAGREIVVVAGNHDHASIEPWLVRRSELQAPEPLGVEQLLEASETSPMLERFAQWASPAHVRSAYPGLWVRPDVYAMHGHYLDCHLTVPTLERLSMGAMSRVLRRPPETFASVEDYEAVTAPMYAWRHAVARDARTGNALNGIATVHAWRALGGGDRKSGERTGGAARTRRSLARRLRTRALVRGFPLAVSALNRAGIGPLRADVSSGELRGAGLRAMGEVASRLKLGDAYVVFGHTHRAGPLPGDDEHEWNRAPASAGGAGGARLVNTGCWTYDSIFLTGTPGESPYWPGSCVLVEDSGAPVLKRLLLDSTHADFKPAPE
jgi:predicted phosphodiesterase